MDYIIENDNKHLIVLVHGLNGGATSWQGNEKRFAERLSEEQLVKEYFDLASFTYGTKIFSVGWLTKLKNTIKGFTSNRPKEDINGFNVGIESVSRVLEAELKGIHEKYKTITFIAHSMGGLVTKSALNWLNNDVLKKVELFISLSVPHIGARLANIGSDLIGNNPQLRDLKAMGNFTTALNERYASLKYLPKVIYQTGNQDTIVPRPSAVPPNVHSDYVESTSDDHFSILLIKNSKNNAVFRTVIKELNGVLQPFKSVEADVPQDTPFQFFVEAMASRFGVQINISCFSPTELSAKLRAGKINSSSVEDFFLQTGNLSIHTFPKYTVERERGTTNYTFKK